MQLCRLQMFWKPASEALMISLIMLKMTFGRFNPP